MKVYIGPYLNYWGPYQVAKLLRKVGVSEERCHRLGEWMSKNWIGDVLQKVYDKRKRKVKVVLHNYDTWNMDDTLCYIIHPMLIQLKNQNCGAPFTNDEDVPEHLRSTNAKPKDNEWDTDSLHFDRWNWIVDEMIWSLDPDWDDKWGFGSENYNCEEYDVYSKRRSNGFRLFGKYFSGLWT